MQLFSLVEKIEGKVRLQKVVFILQEKKIINFNCDFNFAQYGPYSENLQIELEDLFKIGFLKVSSSSGSYTYEINREFPIKVDVTEATYKNRDIILSLIQQESQLLEVTSTIYYLKARNYKEEKSIANKIKVLKPSLENRIEKAFEFYSSLENCA